MADDAATFANLGHALVRTDGALPIISCTKCGAWGNRRTRKLGRPCAAPTAAGEQAVKRILAGKHPLLQRARNGSTLPRAAIAVVARYDAVRGAWISSEPRLDQPQPGPTSSGAAETAAAAAAHDTHHDHDHASDDFVPQLLGDFDPHDEEDVFGHGGGFELNDDITMGSAAAAHEARAADSPLAPPPEAVCSAAQPAASSAPRRRRRGDAESAPRDFVDEAVQRLGATLRRVDTDAAGRMARLRQRVSEKAQRISDGGQRADDANGQGEPKRPRRIDPPEETRATARMKEANHAVPREFSGPLTGHDRAPQRGESGRGHKRTLDDGGLAPEEPPLRQRRLHHGDQCGDHRRDDDGHLERRLRHEGQAPRGDQGCGLPSPRRPHSPVLARLHRLPQRGGDGGDPGARRDVDSDSSAVNVYVCSPVRPSVSLGGPTGIGGASAPASPMGHAEQSGGDHRSTAADADIAIDGEAGASAWGADGASGAALHRGSARGPDASAAAAVAARLPTPTLTETLTGSRGPGGHAREPSPGAAAPTSRAQLLEKLRSASATTNGGSGSRCASADTSGRPRPVPTRDACTHVRLGRPHLIRGRSATCSAADAAGTSGGGAAAANSRSTGDESGARGADVIGGTADAASAGLHPVPMFVMAGVEAAECEPRLADAASAPARRRLTGKQRCLSTHSGASETVASAERAELPPDKSA